jgi:hypothetical protein
LALALDAPILIGVGGDLKLTHPGLSRRTLLVRSGRAAVAAGFLSTFGGPLSAVALSAPPRVRIGIDLVEEQPAAGSFSADPRPLPPGTSHVGIHWTGEARNAAIVHARTYSPGEGWSEWIELAIEDEPVDTDRTYSALLDVRAASHLQYRVQLPSGRKLLRVRLTMIAADAPAPAAGVPLASIALAAGPSASFVPLGGASRQVFSREDWGCDEAIGAKAPWAPMFVPTKRIVVHHTATSNKYLDGAAEVRAIYAYHAAPVAEGGRGWGDIGYNALVDRFGNVYEGRRGRATKRASAVGDVLSSTTAREVLSAGVVAAHCLSYNYGTHGVALLGDFTRRKLNVRDANDQKMLAALEDLVTYECTRAGIHADTTGEFLRSNDLWRDAMPMITGHKDNDATACPGTALSNYIASSLRSKVAARLRVHTIGSLSAARSSGARTLKGPSDIAFMWTGTGLTEVRYWLEGWKSKGSNPDDIVYFDAATGTWSDTERTEEWRTAPPSGSRTFANLPPGRYTLHARGFDSAGRRSAVGSHATMLLTT